MRSSLVCYNKMRSSIVLKLVIQRFNFEGVFPGSVLSLAAELNPVSCWERRSRVTCHSVEQPVSPTARRLFPYLFFVFVFVPAIRLFLSFLRYTFRRATVSCLVPFVLCCVRGTMVMSTSQQVALAFTAVLFTFVVLPRLFGVGVGSAGKENRFDSRYGRKGEDTSALTHRRKRNTAVSFPKCPRRLERCKFPT